MRPRDKKIFVRIIVVFLALILSVVFFGDLLEAIALRLSYGFLSSVMALDLFHMVKTRRHWRWLKVVVIWSLGVTLFVSQFFFSNELIQTLPLDFLMGLQGPIIAVWGNVSSDIAFRILSLFLSLMSLVEFVVSECVPREFLDF